MTLSIYGLDTSPFAERPAEGWVYRSARVDALCALVQERMDRTPGTLLAITGAEGAGKTFRLSHLAEKNDPDHRRLLMIDAGGRKMSARDLIKLTAVMLGLGALTGPGDGGMDEWRAAWDRRTPEAPLLGLLIDHADALEPQALQAIVDMLVHAAQSGLSVGLIGRPRLLTRVHRPAGLHMDTLVFPSLNAEECEAYLRYRFGLVAASRLPYTRLALRLVGSYAKGNPGLIDQIAARSLERGAAANEAMIGERTVVAAASDVVPRHISDWLRRYPRATTLAAAALLAVFGWTLVSRYESTGGQLPLVTAPSVDPEKELARFRAVLPAPATAQPRVWSELLARWQVASRDAGVADAIRCDAQVYEGLNCLSGRGSLDQVRRFDRPMVLELNDPAAQPVLLVGAGELDVRLYTGTAYLDIPQTLLARVWSGRFYAIYKIDPAVPLHTKPGDRGAGAAWITARLPGVTPGTVFDRRAQESLRGVQRSFGMADDGIAGPETLFALAVGDQAGPHLARNVR